MKRFLENISELKHFLILWLTQALSALGTSMTAFGLVIWSYKAEGSALTTALLTVSSYAPYVLVSIFAGTLIDRWDKRRVMLTVDAVAALSTLAVLALYLTDNLQIWHLYALNALSGLMNTVQQPASEVAVTLLTPEKHYQRVSGLKALSSALVTVLTPSLAAALLAFGGLDLVIAFDLCTCAVALVALGFFIRIPEETAKKSAAEPVLKSAAQGLKYLGANRGILDMILFLACINFVASMYNAALPAMLLSRTGGGETVMGVVNTFTGLATLAGSLIGSLCPRPKSRVRVICNALLFSMSTENLLLALGRSAPVWCVGAVLGWIAIPIMNTNLDALFRSYIPVDVQGRVYSARNTLQFFTIPLGYLLGGWLVDAVCEPFMARAGGFITRLLGTGKGSGAALLFLMIAGVGVAICLIFRADKHIWALEKKAE